MQQIFIIGRLTDDAKLISDEKNGEYVSMDVAVNEGSGEKETTTFYHVTYTKNGWFEYLKKGKKVALSGRVNISQREYEGKMRLNIRVFANALEVVSDKTE